MRYIENPPNPFLSTHIEWIDAAPQAELRVYEERVKNILSSNDSPDIGFKYSVNPYRGCFHACAYCYARPTHQYLDLGAGSDFERVLVAKVNAAENLREQFMKRSWKGDTIVFSGVTDCYQPLEASYELTRGCLAVCAEFKNPVGIVTKGALIRRDIDLLTRLRDHANLRVFMSIAFLDDDLSKRIEPSAPRPSTRFRAMKELSEAGIPVGLALAPVIPGLNDSDIPRLLEEAARCGASKAFMTLLRLPAEVKEVFSSRLASEAPTHYEKVLHRIAEMKGGRLNRSEFGRRMHGEGERWDAIEWMFNSTVTRLGLNKQDREKDDRVTFERPTPQIGLFD